MKITIYEYLLKNPDLLHFVRMNPVWYRILSRNPEQISQLEKAAKYFYGKTFPQRMEKVSSQMQFISMLLSLSNAFKE
jgi:hypothetical protein